MYKLLPILFIFLIYLCGCSPEKVEMHNGYYTAEATDFNEEGWKKFITIYVFNNKIVTVEYNAKNRSGLLKTWDVDYSRRMLKQTGTYPNKFIREYSAALLARQNPDDIPAIHGTEDSHVAIRLLAKAAIQKAVSGDTSIAFINLPATANYKITQKQN